MQNMQLRINVNNKIATLVDKSEYLVCGNNDYKVVFDFDGDWDNYNVKTALFVFGDKTISVVFEGDTCDGVAIENSTVCYIGVMAGDVRTTTPAMVNCKLSIADMGETPSAPTEDVYNQIIELLNKYIAEGGGGGGSGGGGYTKEEIERIVAEYLSENLPVLESPTIDVFTITNGHRVVITDINGTRSFDVLNGEKGDKGDKGDTGAQGIQGEKGADGYTPKRGTDYWTPADIQAIHGYIDEQLGSLDTALDEIIALQDYYAGATFDELHEYAVNVAQGGTQ